MQKTARRLAKIIDYALGRRPDEFGLIPDADGYIKVKTLLKALHEDEGLRHVRGAHLNEILITSKNPPFEIAGARIRASFRTYPPIGKPAENLPKLLYTCVRSRAYPYFLENGLKASPDFQPVLCRDPAMALRIGKRHDQTPVMLIIMVAKCADQGARFLEAGEGLYLAERIAPDCFTGPSPPKEKPKPASPAPAEIEPPGSFLMDMEKARQKTGNRIPKGKKDEIPWKKERRRMNRKDRETSKWPE